MRTETAPRRRAKPTRFQVTHSKQTVPGAACDVVRARPIFKRFSDLHPVASRKLLEGSTHKQDVAKFMQYIDSVYQP